MFEYLAVKIRFLPV